jgi:phosphatidylglycerol---prolipoprotein diacylglyceryl transferase
VINYITWSVEPHLFKLNSFEIRWYGLLFASAFYVGFMLMSKIFKQEKVDEKELDSLLVYMLLGTVIGARLGHCLFYGLDYYLQHPLEIFMIWKGGLASHGAAIGILISLYLYSKKVSSKSYLWILDRMVIMIALSGFFIRTGNLMNSEIIGTPTTLPWAFIFTHIDDIPRHPTQLYEALSYLLIFFITSRSYLSFKDKLPEGRLFGLFLILLFSVRFLVEFVKENQEAFEENLTLNMGQLLSIPLIITGFYFYYKSFKKAIS